MARSNSHYATSETDTFYEQAAAWVGRVVTPLAVLAFFALVWLLATPFAGSAPQAADAVLYLLIALTLCATFAHFQASSTGYALLITALVLGFGLPFVLPQLPPFFEAKSNGTLAKIITALTQASAFPGLFGLLLVVKDFFWRLLAGLSLKREEMEQPTTYLHASEMEDREEGDRERQRQKYRLLVVPVIAVAIFTYIGCLGMIRGTIVQGLHSVETAVATVPRPPSFTERPIQGGWIAPSPDPNLAQKGQKPTKQTKADTAIPPFFIDMVLLALGVMFVSRVLLILEWAVYEKGW